MKNKWTKIRESLLDKLDDALEKGQDWRNPEIIDTLANALESICVAQYTFTKTQQLRLETDKNSIKTCGCGAPINEELNKPYKDEEDIDELIPNTIRAFYYDSGSKGHDIKKTAWVELSLLPEEYTAEWGIKYSIKHSIRNIDNTLSTFFFYFISIEDAAKEIISITNTWPHIYTPVLSHMTDVKDKLVTLFKLDEEK